MIVPGHNVRFIVSLFILQFYKLQTKEGEGKTLRGPVIDYNQTCVREINNFYFPDLLYVFTVDYTIHKISYFFLLTTVILSFFVTILLVVIGLTNRLIDH